MSIVYRFKTLDELAAYIHNKGSEIKERSGRNKTDKILNEREGYAWQCVADLIRSTKIEP